MLKVLKNPVTSNYVDLKQFILSNDFVWRYDTSTGMPFYGHTFLERPEETGFSQPLSELVNLNLTVLKEIIDFNNFIFVIASEYESTVFGELLNRRSEKELYIGSGIVCFINDDDFMF